ncbi:MAG: hypothetical protein U0326_18500 [Polyangiales bacterium]
MRTLSRSLTLCLALRSSTVFAQAGTEELARRQLLVEADAARNSGDHARALDRAQRAGQIRMTPSVRLLIAQESEAMLAQPGHDENILVALTAAESCVAEATSSLTLDRRDDILRGCRNVADRMRPRIARVQVAVPVPAPADVRVRVNGAEVPRALWGVDYPVLPGEVVVEASVADGRTFRESHVTPAGASWGVTVEFPAAPPPPRQPPPTPPTREVVTPAPPRPIPPPPRRSVVPWVVVGAGAAVAVSSVIFFALQQGAQGDRERLCPNDASGGGACPSADALTQATSAQSSERAYNTAGWVLAGVGGAAAIGGLVWALTSRGDASPQRTALRWSVTPSAGGVMGVVGGAL